MNDGQGLGGGLTRSASLTFSAQVHSVDAVKRAAYKVCSTASADIAVVGDKISCTLNFVKAHSGEEAQRVIDDFKIEVLDQGLRLQIAEETAATRNAILAYAFSKTGLQGGE